MREELLTWLAREKKKRGWRDAEIARRMHKAQATLSRTLSGKTKLSWDFCVDLAQAFEVPAEKILRLAGLLAPLSSASVEEEEMSAEEISEALYSLQVSDRKTIARIVYALAHLPTVEEQELWDAFRNLQARDRETIAQMINVLAKKQGGQEQE